MVRGKGGKNKCDPQKLTDFELYPIVNLLDPNCEQGASSLGRNTVFRNHCGWNLMGGAEKEAKSNRRACPCL